MAYRRFAPHFVRKQGVQGVGVFTTKPVKKGHLLFKLTGKILTAPTRTSVEIGKNRHVENAIAQYVNHSCAPTAKVVKKNREFVSVRDIEKGEEITFDYNKNESVLASPFKCRCCHKKVIGRKAMALKKK
ncbi:MAG TPA: SET domain-containing protein [Gammaproteobacteria bacterium]|jgi:SET domain-containing protein|nr:SET domain-containing protein [Gammaproteobacteria bacterium]